MNARRVLKPIVVATAVLIGVSPCAAGQDQSWVGEVILFTKPREEVRFQDRLEGEPTSLPFSSHTPIKVLAEREGRLHIRAGDQEGWVKKANFVLLRVATDYFSRRLRPL